MVVPKAIYHTGSNTVTLITPSPCMTDGDKACATLSASHLALLLFPIVKTAIHTNTQTHPVIQVEIC